ncbi:MAG: hypothetical protein LBK54_01635 [Propionibacteriaceae bacterium]|jgi:hypothetical protein|nr:hypothetical protein [Propionibacteriaceae bacterium]
MGHLDFKGCVELLDVTDPIAEALLKAAKKAGARFQSAMVDGTVAEFALAAAWADALEDAARPIRQFTQAIHRRTKEIEEEAKS